MCAEERLLAGSLEGWGVSPRVGQMWKRGAKKGEKWGNGTMSLIILTASPIEVAWNPILFIPLIISLTVMSRPANLLKSSSSTFWEPSGISFEGTRTASVTELGSGPCSEFAVMVGGN